MSDDLVSTANAIGEALLKRDESFSKINKGSLTDAYNEISAHSGPGGFYFFLRQANEYGPESELFLRCLKEDELVLTALKKHLPFIIQDTDGVVTAATAIIVHIMTLDGQMMAVDMYRKQAGKFEVLPRLIQRLDSLSERHQEHLGKWRELFGTHTFNLEDDPAPTVVSAPSLPNH